MSINHARSLAALFVLATLASYGCENDNGSGDEQAGMIGPSPISFSGVGQPTVNSTDFFARGVTLQPAVVIPQPATGASCPTRPPFLAPIRVTVSNSDDEDAFLSDLQMNFVGRSGRTGETLTLSRSQLVNRFGSVHIPRFGTRVFPLTLPFGCTGDRAGLLSVGVLTTDSHGRTERESLTVEVR
jgi:hypothetical protein